MDTHQRVLQRQQMVLKHLGYYRGRCDGIWSRKTITAKRDFELSGKFNPGYPNNGMPFNCDGPFPSGIIRDPLNKHLIIHVDMDREFIARLEGELVTCTDRFDPEPQADRHADSVDKTEPQTVVEVPQAESVESSDSTEAKLSADKSGETTADKSGETTQERPQRQHNVHHKHQHNKR